MTDDELTVAVAERVMGWRLATDVVWGTLSMPAWLGADGYYRRDPDDWSPPTSIADAWQVVEAMRARGYIVSLDSFTERSQPSPDRRWWCTFTQHARSWPTWADTAPRAICLASLAALAAVGEG